MSNRELLLALADELSQGEQILKPPLDILCDVQIPEDCLSVAKDDYCEFTTRVAGVAEAINLSSLQALMAFVDTNISMVASAPADQRSDKQISELLWRWPGMLAEFMRNADDPDIEQKLRQFLLDNSWPWQVDNSQFESMLRDIQEFSGSKIKTSLHTEEEELINPTLADVSVAIPDDISAKLLITFQQELPQSTAELSQRIQKLFDPLATSEDISEARRVAHTLKGAANIVGVTGIANITHYLEDILETLVNKNALPGKELADSLMEVVDCLEVMSEATLGISQPPPQAIAVLQSLLDLRRRFKKDDFPELKTVGEVPTATIEVTELNEAQLANELSSTVKVEPAKTEQTVSIPVKSNIFDKLLDLAGELSSSNLLTQGQLQSVVKNSDTLIKFHSRLRANIGMLQEMISSQGLKRSFLPGSASGSGLDGKFDPLEMDQYNELHSLANVITEIVDDVSDVSNSVAGQLVEIRELLNQQDQLNKELDQSITAERLVPIKSILPRLQRSVRQTCKMVDKKAELIVQGDALNIDNAILDTIVDPLLHMLRNAVDHGIESAEQRQAAGKNEIAKISLEFKRLGNNIVINCKDDGRGINANAVKRKALELGLIGPEQILTENTLYELILQPGFSTNTDVNQVSGRGIGMDVVATKISELRGSLSIKSEENVGTDFTITVPQTLLKTHVVLLRSGDLIFGVLSGSFSQIVSIESDLFFHDDEDDNYVSFNDQVYEVKNIAGLLGVNQSATNNAGGRSVALLIDDGEFLNAALIDEAVGSGELVIKKIGKYVPRVSGIIGTVLMEDGNAAPVFDLKELLRKPSRVVSEFLQKQIDQPLASALNVLIVDDSSSARRSMSQVAKDAGYEVRTAIDGMEAISLIEEQCPDLLLTDLEMPKMNGLELAAHLRSVDGTRDIPIVMVTSRSTEKHRNQAMSTGINSYITKPYTNDDLIFEMHQLLQK